MCLYKYLSEKSLTFISLLLIKDVCVLILQWFKFFVEFLELISLIGLSYSSNNVTISMIICVEVRIFSQFVCYTKFYII
jgi:hypothetical protein